jgi:hypothetical protein
MKNTDLFNASVSLVQAAYYVKFVDKDFANKLLDKAEEYKKEIVVDKELEGEIIDFEERIKKL